MSLRPTHSFHQQLDVLRILSEWLSVLEDRGTVPGTSLGPLLDCVGTFEAALSQVEAILTTPLPLCVSFFGLSCPIFTSSQ